MNSVLWRPVDGKVVLASLNRRGNEFTDLGASLLVAVIAILEDVLKSKAAMTTFLDARELSFVTEAH